MTTFSTTLRLGTGARRSRTSSLRSGLSTSRFTVIAEGDFVAVHADYKTWNMAAVDIFRLNDDGKIVEHWDVLQQVPETTASGNDMFSQLS